MFDPQFYLYAFLLLACLMFFLPVTPTLNVGGAMTGGAIGSIIPGVGTGVGAAVGGLLDGLFGGGSGRPPGWQAGKDSMGASIVEILSGLGVLTDAVRSAVLNKHFGYDTRERTLLAFQAGDVRGAAQIFAQQGVPVDQSKMIANFESAMSGVPASSAAPAGGGLPSSLIGSTSGGSMPGVLGDFASNPMLVYGAAALGALLVLPKMLGGRRRGGWYRSPTLPPPTLPPSFRYGILPSFLPWWLLLAPSFLLSPFVRWQAVHVR